ncbi:TetR/AcrR family transcriptional regulator [Caulobacter hibisci]|uniref:TetR/AcrR family transcriptional regulator n=1 Tax=Caulobacter hibisci TaxID=2035993 RepID=A0ABS0SZ28_9CAUL|nr:TetR/AcrR family transcriptional regulator [Caulobacter hibisci]MBI1684120.1 TetR/AcrR family transcriptional regulator [Caulobacter hibisci]
MPRRSETAHAEIRDRLLAVAAEIFAREGFAAAKIGEIAAAAGVSKKTIYRYVCSKEDLFVEVVRARLGQVALVLAPGGAGGEPRERLKAFLLAFGGAGFSPEGVASYRLILAEGARFPEVAQAWTAAISQQAIQALGVWLAQVAPEAGLTIEAPEQAAGMLLAMIFAEPMRDAALGVAPVLSSQDLDLRIERAISIFLGGAFDRPTNLAVGRTTQAP